MTLNIYFRKEQISKIKYLSFHQRKPDKDQIKSKASIRQKISNKLKAEINDLKIENREKSMNSRVGYLKRFKGLQLLSKFNKRDNINSNIKNERRGHPY